MIGQIEVDFVYKKEYGGLKIKYSIIVKLSKDSDTKLKGLRSMKQTMTASCRIISM